MSSWSKFTNYLPVPGRFSPFTRSPASGGEPPDSAFSYITADDLKRNAVERSHGDDDESVEDGESRHHHHKHKHSRDQGASSSRTNLATDSLIIKSKREAYAIHFPALSIDRGELRVGDIRAAAAKKTNSDSRFVKLFYKGRNLKDDNQLARNEGLASGHESELLCVVGGDQVPVSPKDESDGESDEGVDETPSTADGGSKRKKRKPRKKKAASKPSEANGYSTPPPSGTATFIPPSAIPRSTTSTPAPSATATPLTPLDKINKLDAKFRDELVPLCSDFLEKPPADKAKKDYEHKKLSETIMGQILLKLDAVEVEGDNESRMRRKEVIRDVQGWLNKLDGAVN